MKRSFVIAFVAFFVMTIMAKDLAGLGWDIWYVVNKTYVAKELCVNKARPALKCNGKCHLAKQLQQLEESETAKATPGKQKSPVPKKIRLREISWIASGSALNIETAPAFKVAVTSNGWLELNGALSARSTEVFRPPSA
jgi:hypothetical protein